MESDDALQHHELLDIGKGVLILVQKPGKPTGPLTSLRPIVLLSVLRKTLSLIVLSRIAPKVDEYLSSSQSGFRRGRSTADSRLAKPISPILNPEIFTSAWFFD